LPQISIKIRIDFSKKNANELAPEAKAVRKNINNAAGTASQCRKHQRMEAAISVAMILFQMFKNIK
jgi:hypothetical protein